MSTDKDKETQIKVKVCKQLIEETIGELKELNVDVSQYLLSLAVQHNNNDNINDDDMKKDEEKSNDKTTNQTISLLPELNKDYKYGLCQKGHTLTGIIYGAITSKCRICDNKVYAEETVGVCPCGHHHIQCSKKMEVEIKQKLKENQVFKSFLIFELQKRPEISLDLLCFLRNRTALNCLLTDIIDAGYTEAQNYLLILFDLDHFKDLNTKLGHDGADLILKKIGEIIRNMEKLSEADWKQEASKYVERGMMDIYDSDNLKFAKETASYSRVWGFRNGGDEFAIVVKENYSHYALSSLIIDKLRSDLSIEYEKFVRNNNDKFPNAPESVGISIGMAKYHQQRAFQTNEAWFKCADDALYVAKNKGRNTDRIWNNMLEKYETFEMLQGRKELWYIEKKDDDDKFSYVSGGLVIKKRVCFGDEIVRNFQNK